MQSILTDLPRIWLAELEPTLTRYAIFTVGVWLALWVLLRPLTAARKIRADTPSFRQMLTELMFSLRSMAIFATMGVITVFMYRAGLYPMAGMTDGWGPAWFALSIVAGIVGLDAWFYWTHRL